MGRIVFVTPFAGGNLPPTLAIASALARAEHDVAVLGHSQIEAAVKAAGLTFHPFTHARPWSPVVDRPGTVSMLRWLLLAADRGIARDLAAELVRLPADVVVVDCMLPVALRPARQSGARVVMLIHAFSAYWQKQWELSSPMGAWQRFARVHPRKFSADLAVVSTAPEFDVIDVPGIPAARVEQTGPVLPQPVPPRQAGAVEPSWDVLVSFSTISYPEQDAALQRALDAIGELPISAVATVGPSVGPHAVRLPPNVERREFVPHAELLPYVKVLVGHGGHGTAMSALAHGVPILVIAMSTHADQPLVGEAVARAGVGLVLPRRATTDEIRDAISQILAGSAFGNSARAIAATLRQGDGATRAADAIADLLPNMR